MPQEFTRRSFLATTAATTAALAATGAVSAAAPSAKPATTTTSAPSRKLNLAIIGTGSRGMDHVREISAIDSANVIAVCDADALMLVAAARHFPKAQPFTDFREVLKLKELEAVVIATPDHNHAMITAAALRAGKHVYCEKPLCHTVKEVRAIADLAKETKLVTQMGIQIHALDNYRRVVELIQGGEIGPVSEVHIWNTRPTRPIKPEVVEPPANLNYDLWLQPLPHEPFHPDFHPFNWRAYWSFGEAMLGDIGCHLMDIAFWSLKLGPPTRIEAQGEPRDERICPDWIIATYDFPAREGQPPVKLTWWDNPKRPPQLDSWKLDKGFEEAVLFIGEKGMLATDYNHHQLLPVEQFKDFKRPAQSIAPSPGHQKEWIEACLANNPAACSAAFSYGALLSETALLGVVAFRNRKAIEWDSANLKIPNAPEAERFLENRYREGFKL